MSEPKKPIVFYVDHTVPKKYQRYVRDGIEMWQKAFEAAGFKNAIIAKEAPTFEEDPDYDPEDARYNTIRWIVSDEPSFGAIGPSRVDPRTGEILDADILIEQDMLSGFRQGYRRFAGPDACLVDVDPILSYLTDPAQDPEAARRVEIERRIGARGELHFGTGFANGLEFLHLALLADGAMEPGMDVPEEYIGEALRWVVCHEVGHTLGLRHNFKSSAATPFDKLNDRYAIGEIGMTGSIMDYAAPNISRDRTRQGFYYSPTVGTWDQWAIEWGYTEIPGEKSPAKEAVALRDIAGKAHLKENTYGAEEDTYPAGAMDPLCATFDLSDDPLAWAKERIGVCDDIIANGKLEERVVSEGGNYVPLRYAVETLLIQEYLAMSRAVKYVGGQFTARPHRGSENGDLPMMPVPAAKQREALQFVVQNGLQTDALALPPDLMNRLADNKTSDWQNPLYTYGRRFDFPLTEWVAAIHNALLKQLMDPMLMQRVVEAQYKADDPYRLSELFSSLTDAIWLKDDDAERPDRRHAAESAEDLPRQAHLDDGEAVLAAPARGGRAGASPAHASAVEDRPGVETGGLERRSARAPGGIEGADRPRARREAAVGVLSREAVTDRGRYAESRRPRRRPFPCRCPTWRRCREGSLSRSSPCTTSTRRPSSVGSCLRPRPRCPTSSS